MKLWFSYKKLYLFSFLPVDLNFQFYPSVLSLYVFHFFIHFFTGSSEYDQCKKDLAALLCVSDKTHSQLSDMV